MRCQSIDANSGAAPNAGDKARPRFSLGDVGQVDDVLGSASAAEASQTQHDRDVAALVEMGYEAKAAKQALLRAGNVDDAALQLSTEKKAEKERRRRRQKEEEQKAREEQEEAERQLKQEEAEEVQPMRVWNRRPQEKKRAEAAT